MNDRPSTQREDLLRYEMLSHLADLLVGRHRLEQLLPALAERVKQVLGFDFLVFSLCDPPSNDIRIHICQDCALLQEISELAGADTPSRVVWATQQPIHIPHISYDERFPEATQILRKKGVVSYCVVPLTTAERRIGALGFGTSRQRSFEKEEQIFLTRVAKLVALAVQNAMVHAAFQEERARIDASLEVSKNLLSNAQVADLFPCIAEFVQEVVKQDFASLAIYDEQSRQLTARPLHSKASQKSETGETFPTSDFALRQTFLHGKIKHFAAKEMAHGNSAFLEQMREKGIQSLCVMPLIGRKGMLGTLTLGSLSERAFVPQDESFLAHVAAQIALTLDSASAHKEVEDLTQRLKAEKICREEEIASTVNFEEIVGDSPSLRRTLSHVQTVAPSDATVLILGETGTGKELIARAIHRMSARRDEPFIKLNCAAIPTGLFESELFGHEKGAFTGAVSQKVGRLELAHKGTLFLDEVGEIPLESQPKLLRVLQDQEFERLGGNRTIRVNVRIVAATNRDLGKSVAEREFRSDLYYRLHVFPVRLPPLRERTVDIPLLVRYFVQKFARRANKQIDTIPSETMNVLVRWHWPGNVRELENFLERSVILTDGAALNAPLAELSIGATAEEHASTLFGVERDHILRILRETGGVIAGAHGAAAKLGMKRTTLQSKMQRMGISRSDYES